MEYNTSVHETTGYIPFELTVGRQASMPSSISNTPTLSKEQLFNLWKNQYNIYIVKARQITESNKKRYQRDQIR